MGSQLEESTAEEEQKLGEVSQISSTPLSGEAGRRLAMREAGIGEYRNASRIACTDVAVLTCSLPRSRFFLSFAVME